MATAADIGAVNEFLLNPKQLYGAPPEFGPSNYHRRVREWEAVWPIADHSGIVGSGQLRFIARPGAANRHSISLIFIADNRST